MGYDMYLEDTDAGTFDQTAYKLAEAEFHEAIKVRDRGNPEAAQDAVDAAYDAMQEAQWWYFRLNIWGMHRYRDFMETCGMIYEADSSPWPDSTEVEAADWDEDSEAYHAYEAAAEKVRRESGEMPGIPLFKLCSNDDWLVLPLEAQTAVEQWEKAGKPVMDGDEEGYWLKWIEFLRKAAEHGGFRVR